MAGPEDVVVVGAARTAIGTFGGSLRDVAAADLGAHVIRAALERARVPAEDVDEVILGCVGQVAENAFIARMAALRAGLPVKSTALTVNRLCGSGLQAILSGVHALQLGLARVVVAGGTENMSQLPFYVRRSRWDTRLGHSVLQDGVLMALTDPFGECAMGVTAEVVAERWRVTRADQDAFALESQRRAARAIAEGRMRDEIAPIEVVRGKGERVLFDTDEHPRPDTTLERLSRLKPAFRDGGTVTAGNASGINDGAAAVVLMTAREAERRGLEPLGRYVSEGLCGLEPEIMGMGPVGASRQALERAGLRMDDLDLIELNEAFAAQAVAVMRETGMDPEKTNVNGGAIALGHPIGATGAILTVKLLYELRRRQGRLGLVTMCIGGGQGIAAIFERA